MSRQTDLPADDAYIEAKVEEVQDVYGEVFEDEPVLVAYDMNGPIVATDTKALQPYDGVAVAMQRLSAELDDPYGMCINSGYDIASQRAVRERLGTDLGLIGEHGSVYEADGTVVQTAGTGKERLVSAEQALYEQAATAGWKLSMQSNVSHTTGAVAIEAENSAGIDAHPLADLSHTTDALWWSLSIYDGFCRSGDGIIADTGPATIEQLSRVLKREHTYLGVRFDTAGEHIQFWRDPNDATIDPETVGDQLDDVLSPLDWDVSSNPDRTFDYTDQTVALDKTDGMDGLAAEQFGEDTAYRFTIIGDNPGDIPSADHGMFFAQKDTTAEQYCEQNDIPHVTVRDAADYSQILTELHRQQ